jgi:enoyl-CoA hydratase/carnithine racemase
MTIHATLETGPLLRTDEAGVATLVLNRPGARNALSEALLAAMTAELASIAADRSVRAVVLTAAGPVFSAGHDLKEMSARRSDPDGGRAYTTDIMERCSTAMQAIVRLPVPVIAAVEGVATAAGCQLVASADLAVAGRDAQFCTPGVHIGLFCSTPMVALSRNLGRKHAMEMLLLGEMVPARRRCAWASSIAWSRPARLSPPRPRWPHDRVEIHRRGPAWQKRLLRAARHAAGRGLSARLQRDGREHDGARRSRGIGAVLAKRAPVWSGE